MRVIRGILAFFVILTLAACGGDRNPTSPGGGDAGGFSVDAAAIRPQLLGLSREVKAIAAAPNAEPWAVSSAGTVLRRVDGLWDAVALPAERDWRSGWGVLDVLPSGTVVFYDGRDDLITYDGSDWTITQMTGGYLGSVEAMLAVAEDEVYLVRSREIWRWNGEDLEEVTPTDAPPSARFNAIDARDGRTVVVGRDGAFALSHGGAFALVDIGTTVHIEGVWIDPARNAWLVGGNGFLARYNLVSGDDIEVYQTPDTDHYELITGTGPSLIYFGGKQIHRFDGVSFAPIGAAFIDYGTALWSRAGNDLAIGGGWSTWFMVYDGNSWEPALGPTVGATAAVYGAPDGTLIVGGPVNMMHLQNGSWVTQPETSGVWWTLGGIASDDVWGFGNDASAWRWNGASWSSFPLPIADPWILGLWAAASDDVHAVGRGGIALHWDGSTWNELSTPTTANLSSVAGGPGGVFARGGDTLLQWIDGAWVDIASPLTDSLRQLGNLGDVVFLRSRDEMLINRTGEWEPFALPAELRSARIEGSALDDIFGVIPWRSVYHFDGEALTPIPTIEVDARLGVASTGRGELVVAGSGGVVRFAVDTLDLVR